jgi:hypothetical protein
MKMHDLAKYLWSLTGASHCGHRVERTLDKLPLKNKVT